VAQTPESGWLNLGEIRWLNLGEIQHNIAMFVYSFVAEIYLRALSLARLY